MNNVQLTTDIFRYLPTWYQNILDYQAICATEEQQFEALAQFIDQVHQNFYFQTMDLTAIEQWEQIFQIVPNPNTETQAFRQMRLLNRMSSRPPYTLGFLYQKLDELIGPGQWNVTVDYPNYALYIESSASDQSYANEVEFTVGKIKPAHIAYINTPLTTATMIMSEEISSIDQVTWNYNLGGWGLGILPFASETGIEVLKLPTTPSLQAQILNSTATFVAGDIASARVNGTIPISTISSAAADNTVTVTYLVSQSDTTAITQVELLDANGNVLTSSNIYAPVPVDGVNMKHVIPVQEGTNYGN